MPTAATAYVHGKSQKADSTKAGRHIEFAPWAFIGVLTAPSHGAHKKFKSTYMIQEVIFSGEGGTSDSVINFYINSNLQATLSIAASPDSTIESSVTFTNLQVKDGDYAWIDCPTQAGGHTNAIVEMYAIQIL